MRDEINVDKLRRMNRYRTRTDVENLLLKEMVEYDVRELLFEADDSAIDAIAPDNVLGDSLFGDNASDNDILNNDDDVILDFNMTEI